ncbi:MAG TPA: transcription termination factor Rho [Phycisphaerae bacterium]|jgi:transcription termination factor Rho|nr:transcription termination factor Rho [Phycisphaerae bacterium]HOB76732.1 transcription termination factor Rho [Phycisphaerae bacterium]HOJ56778.1 transcription termination factor Rho [Phycisphaerae bacterium]HOL28518.1 transcription termination factor Rho [Phycisphaerae bacterium]HPP23048.1 transcription termination factor Rho [Phycisphaerae bacterium]
MSESIAEGTFELQQEKGWGFLRSAKRNYAIHQADPLVPAELVRRFDLRGGETVIGPTRRGSGRQHGVQAQFSLVTVDKIDGMAPDARGELQRFNELTVIDPRQTIRFETPGGPLTMRVLDLMTPIGRGQRGLIAAPPRTGKTILLQQMAAGIAANHPDIYMMVLLIDERPEEVTEMRRTVRGEVVFSSNDQNIASHIRIARLMIEKAKRMVETGQHVLILLDSLTRLGRAFNAGIKSSGRTMSGGVDIRALEEPKAIFGAARNIENGGSLTIMASALIETGSRMDELIFNEFKGTGNMEIMLSRDLANLRIWPAMDLNLSGTRKEELLLGKEAVEKIYRLRRQLAPLPPPKAMQTLQEWLAKTPSNQAFLDSLAK